MNPSWRLGRDIHVAHGPESRHHTPSAAAVLTKHVNGNAMGVSRAGVCSACQDRERHGQGETGNRSRGQPGLWSARADTDVLVASPGKHYPPRLPTPLTTQWKSSVLDPVPVFTLAFSNM